MRIDKYLKVTRLIKRREIAKNLCDAGFVKINNKKAKPMNEVKVNDEIEITINKKVVVINVNEIYPYANKENANKMYKIKEERNV